MYIGKYWCHTFRKKVSDKVRLVTKSQGSPQKAQASTQKSPAGPQKSQTVQTSHKLDQISHSLARKSHKLEQTVTTYSGNVTDKSIHVVINLPDGPKVIGIQMVRIGISFLHVF